MIAPRAADTVPSATRAAPGDWLGYPKGAWLIVGVEFWERFSFYGMLAILALFLTGAPMHGGFGWSDAKALTLVGIYSGAMYALPAFGGYLADHLLGRRRAVMLGASLMLAGQILMASPYFIPALLGAWRGAPLLDALHQLGVPMGLLVRPESVERALAIAGTQLGADGVRWLTQSYVGSAIGFYAAITCLILGNALMKSTLVVLCGETFSANDSRREGAYAYYYLGIAVGALLSGIVVGWVVDEFGWHLGFAAAALGMAVALGSYLMLAPRWLGVIGMKRSRAEVQREISTHEVGDAAQSRREVWLRLVLIFVLAMLLCVFSIGWFQLYGTWSLFIERHVDRSIGAFSIPVPWFASWNALVVIVLAPALAALWLRLARTTAADIVRKYAVALGLAAAGQFLMYMGALWLAPGQQAPLWIPVVAVAFTAIGELVAWTSTYGIVIRAAPAGLASATMGAWYLLTLGLGGYLSGATARWLDAFGYATTFLLLGLSMAVGAFVTLGLRGPLRRLAQRCSVVL